MKYSPNHISADPTAKIGNRKVKNSVRVAVAAATLALAACTPHASDKDAAPKAPVTTTVTVPETTAPTVSPEQKIAHENEQVKVKAQATAENFASRIITEFNEHKSKHNFLYEPKDGSDFHAVNVLYDTKTLLAGAYGEYGLVATVNRNAKGELDPSTVDSVMLFTNVNVAGKEVAKNPGDRENIYSFSLMKDKNTGDWSIGIDHANKGGMDKLTSDTSRTTTDQYNTPITVEQFDSYVGQANTMFDWAVHQTPVDHIPAAAK